jgi:hypothetical protein|tara:strand:+ start:3516 stop:3956 length:441 start_codon:yes stop_codon:yes gene_type:complete
MAYSGRYIVKNPKKYEGDFNKVKYRSLWERQAFKWLDNNLGVIGWSSEEVIVPYRCKTDGKVHRYFVDLFIRTKNGKVFLIEIKPKKQTLPPKKPSRKTKRYLSEVMTYAKNQSKWEAATAYANKYGMTFEVWNEDTLRSFGIKIL